MQHSFKVFLFTSFIFLVSCSNEKQTLDQKAPSPLQVNTITVHKEAVPIWKKYTAMTKASSQQAVKARVSGVLEKRYFEDGQVVKKGQKLFKIEQSEYIANLNIAKAKKAQDEAAFALAKADVQRYAPLVAEGLAPRSILEQYQANKKKLLAIIAGDVAQIHKAQLQLDYKCLAKINVIF